MDYRPVPEDEDHREALHRLLIYAFHPESGPDPDRERPSHPRGWYPRALYDVAPGADAEAADMAVACAYYDFEARVRGDFRSVGGVSAVASPPERRRQGLVGEMLGELHRECREEERTVAALWPFEYGFYRRYGYARVSHGARTTVSPGDLDGAAGDPAGRFRRLAAEDWAVADGVYREWATEAFGLRRSEGFWRHRVFEGWRDDPYVYAWADEDGTARGYLVYTFEDGDDGREMRVVELAYADDEARAQLYRFLRDHDSQVESVRVRGPTPVSTRLFDELADPRAADVELRPGAMARLVDVPAALESFAYPGDVAGRVTVAVTDDHCPWNDATVRLDVADGTATCRETDADPDVRAGVGTLTQVAVGSHGVAAAERDGDLSVATPAARETLAALFPPEPVYLREGF